jgi:hypothetical protein
MMIGDAPRIIRVYMNAGGDVNRAVEVLQIVRLLVREASDQPLPDDAGHRAGSEPGAGEEE